MDLLAIRQALATQIDVVPGLRASAVALDSPSPPVAIVYPATGGPFLLWTEQTSAPDQMFLTVTVLVAKTEDRAGQNALDAFVNSTSVWAAITDTKLGGLCSFCQFTEARNYGYLDWAGAQYYGFELGVEVYA